MLTARKKNEEREKLLFLHARIIPDFEESGGLTTLVPHKKLCTVGEQDVNLVSLVGRTPDVDSAFDGCLQRSEMVYTKSGTAKRMVLVVPEDTRLRAEDIPDDGPGGYVSHVGKIEGVSWFPEFFLNEDFLDALSGYSVIQDVSPISPTGLYDKGWLFGRISHDVYAVKEERTACVSFHGVRSTAVNRQGCREIKGFVQSRQRSEGDRILLCDSTTGVRAATAGIDVHGGTFLMQSEKPVKDGRFIYDTRERIPETAFHLIMGFDLKTEVADTTFKDAYGNEILLSGKKPRPESCEDTSWFDRAFATPEKAEEALHDIMVEALALSGPNIVIADPYFMGDVEESAGGWKLSAAQRAFVNAMVKVHVVYGLESVTLLGNNRMKSQVGKDVPAGATAMQALMDRYRRFWEYVYDDLQSKGIRPWRMEIKNAGADFHNRYWFAADGRGRIMKERAVSVSNSISGMEEADFCLFGPSHYLDAVTARYEQFMKNAKTILSV